MTQTTRRPFRLLFLCTGNSARSQIAEAILNWKGNGQFHAESAGSHPAAQDNPYAIAVLAEAGIAWTGHAPRTVEGLEREPWDFVITVCDRAKESCPLFPGHPALAHWGMPDPADVEGSEEAKRAAFRNAFVLLSRRIDLLLALPFHELERMALESHVRSIGEGTAPRKERVQ